LALDGFFDDIKLPREPQIVGVAGFLFDLDGLKRFDSEWAPRVAGLDKPYRTASCFGCAPPFSSWLEEDRKRLLKDLAVLIADTRDAGFTATVELSEYHTFIRKHPDAANVIGSPYALSLLVIVESVLRYMKEAYPGETVNSWFEKGDIGPDEEAAAFLRRACKSWEQTGPAIIERFSFAPKTSALALCAADFLAWEWQRNYYEMSEREMAGEKDGGQWRDNFKLLFKQDSKPIYPNPLWERRLELREMINSIAKLHKD
jgi:hypothetical protein